MTAEPHETNALEGDLQDVIDEIRAGLVSSAFELVPTESTAATLSAAAALAHCCELGEVMVSLHRAGRELAARIVCRSLFESWIVGLFCHYGGPAAYDALWDDYFAEIKKIVDESAAHDKAYRAKQMKVEQSNARIRRDNQRNRAWNEGHPTESPRPIRDELPPPPGVPMELDWSAHLKIFDGRTPTPLSLKTMVDRLRTLTADAGDAQSFDAAYVYMYRGLSSVGAHVTPNVLEWYLAHREGGRYYVHVDTNAHPPSSLEATNLHGVLLLLCHLGQRVLGSRNVDTPVSTAAFERLAEAIQAPAAADKDGDA